MPFKYLDEVKNAPQSRLSFPLFSKLAFLLNHSNAPQQTDAAAHVIRSDLNKHLPALVSAMQEECTRALDSQMPRCDAWTPVYPYMTIAQAVAQITTRVLCGQELASDEEWIKMSVETTINAMQTGVAIREKYPPYLRWLAPYLMDGSKLNLANRMRAAEVISTVMEKRIMAGTSDGTGHGDGIQWLLAAAGGARRKPSLELADEQLFLTIASIHSTSASTLSILHDLADHPVDHEDIVKELEAAEKACGGVWTKQNLSKLDRLDSFMKESQRVHPIGLVNVTRSAVKPYTFKDGFHLPAHTLTSFPMAELNHDPDIWRDSATFDGLRFLRMRQQGDPNAWQFAFVGENSINFGAGTHACPGRYYASLEIKLMLAHLLLKYEIKWPEGKSRPANMAHDFATPPSPMAEMMFLEKEKKKKRG
ncbi:MAG: hypothetical protein Q9197_000872 [Variospora fuerteventurae]